MLINIRGTRPEHNIDSLPVDENASVSELRRLVAERLHVSSPSRVRLVYCGRLLDDAQPVSYYNIQEGRALHMVVSAADAASHNGATRTTAPAFDTTPGTGATSPDGFAFFHENASNVPNLAQMSTNVGTMLASVAPFLSGVQQAVPLPQSASVLTSLIGAALQQQAQSAMGVPTGGTATGTGTGVSGFPSATTATGTTATTTPAPVPGFPQAPRADSARQPTPTTVPTAGPGPSVSRGIPLARTTSSHVPDGAATVSVAMAHGGGPQVGLTPLLGGVYVHVHCDFNELDHLPERLMQLQQRMAMPHVVFHAHGPATTTTPPTTTSTAAATSPAATSAVATVRQVEAPEAGTSMLLYETTPVSQARQESTVGTRQENLQRWFGALSRDANATPLMLPSIFSALGPHVGIAGVAPLLAGNWAPIAQQRPLLESELLHYMRAYCPGGVNSTDLCEREAWRLYEHLWSQDSIRRLVTQEQRPEMGVVDPGTGRTPLQNEFLSYLRTVTNRIAVMMHTARGGLDDQAWMLMLRTDLVRLVGVAYLRSHHWFTQGSAALTHILLESMEILITQSRSSAAAMTAMLPMLRMSLPTLLQSWASEYEQSGLRSEGDDAVFRFRYFPEETREVATRSEADLLDEALTELQEAPRDAAASASAEAVRTAIGEWAAAAHAPADVVDTLRHITSQDQHR